MFQDVLIIYQLSFVKIRVVFILQPTCAVADLPDMVQKGATLIKLSSRSFELQKSAVGSVRPISRTASYSRMLIVSYTTITDGNLNLYTNRRQNVNLYDVYIM